MNEFKNTFIDIVKDVTDSNKSYNNIKYQDTVSYKKRCEDSNRLLIKYPNYIPVIVNCFNPEIQIKKNKFLVPKDIAGTRLILSIRSQIVLPSSFAIFMFIDNILIDHSKNITEIYQEYMDKRKNTKDKYMYVDITLENTFGY